MSETLPWTRRIARAIFLGMGGCLILSIPFLLFLEEGARAALLKHDPSDVLFRTFVKTAAKELGIGAGFLVLGLLLAKDKFVTLALALNVALLVSAWVDGVRGKDVIIVVPLLVSLTCLVVEAYKTMGNLRGRTA